MRQGSIAKVPEIKSDFWQTHFGTSQTNILFSFYVPSTNIVTVQASDWNPEDVVQKQKLQMMQITNDAVFCRLQ